MGFHCSFFNLFHLLLDFILFSPLFDGADPTFFERNFYIFFVIRSVFMEVNALNLIVDLKCKEL